MLKVRVELGSRRVVALEQLASLMTPGTTRTRIEGEAASLLKRVSGVRCPTHGEGSAVILLSYADDAKPVTKNECCSAFREALEQASRRSA